MYKTRSRLLATFVCLFSVLAFAASWQQKLEDAENLFAEGRYKEALELYHEVAENTASQHAQFRIGFIHSQGLGVPVNLAEAARWYTLSGNQGNTTAQNNLSVIYSTGGPGLVKNPTLALHWLKRAAEGQDARAMANLSYRYAEGDGVEKDPYMAYDLAKRSASKDDVYGKFRLALCYLNSIGVPLNVNEAVSLLEEVANNDDQFAPRQTAQFLLAETYRSGEGVPAYDEEAYFWYLLAATGGDVEIAADSKERIEQYQASLPSGSIASVQRRANSWRAGQGASILGLQQTRELLLAAIEEERYQEAAALAISLAEQGDAAGESIMGWLYESGKGVAQNDREAVQWYRKAADNGVGSSQLSLAKMYYEGRGVQKDLTKALDWFRAAAEQGDTDAQVWIGDMYQEGLGVEKNDAEALKWYRKAALRGDAYGQILLASAYANGIGTPTDYQEAVKWMRMAARQGDETAQFFLAMAYERGEGVARDDHEAVYWFEKAAEQSEPDAMYGLAEMIALGRGTNKDPALASQWFKAAADAGVSHEKMIESYTDSAGEGDAASQYWLGVMYAVGRGIERDNAKAKELLLLADDNGYPAADETLKALGLAPQ